ncbi:hypothetical protein FIV42_23755 [Persicimonas caeni]|uniref:DUF4336 domain-containing protein n=1 Tax=Persicimonas caeni TaxID=2292766 RepID=A0A4Y6PZI1_PERCE|nr:hypothetical protein [Persicimonas caeni]QDG53650.1 hypothetical protein FIV42_23755 [Persicimonas caeni]QED34871.1 hypothetical protein FRD00_23750 [Persicimonas caeni]
MLEPISPTIWGAEHDVKAPGGIIFRSRMSVVDLGDGELLLHSPVPIDDALAAEIDALGTVRWIVAPNDQHHLYAGEASARYPGATLLGTQGARDNEPDVEFDAALEDGAPPEWAGRLEMVGIEGTRYWNEFVFYEPKSRTLICSDLVFNIHEIPNFATNLMLTLVGGKGGVVQTRSERWFLVKDRPSYAESIAKVLAWDFDRLVMGHGRVVETGGYEELARAVRWALPSSHREKTEQGTP